MELVRAILLAIESNEIGTDPNNIAIDGFSDKQQISYHCYLLHDAGLIRGEIMSKGGFGTPSEVLPHGLTWAGHEFLDASKEPTRWEEAKAIMNSIGGASLQVWMMVLREKAEEAVKNMIS